jgi:hypothetical protein
MAMPEGEKRSTAINGGQLQQATTADDWSDDVIIPTLYWSRHRILVDVVKFALCLAWL